MSKFILTIEGSSLKEVLDELSITQTKGEGESYEDFNKRLSNTRLPRTTRANKKWTEFELEFLRDNYRSKNMKWIANALHRPRPAVSSKLHMMYNEGLPRKQSRVKNL